MDTVAAVIVTYNRKALLEKAVQAVLRQTRPADLLLIIDNASNDGTNQYLQDLGYLDNSRISYIRLPENTGGAGGFHEGMKQAFAAGYTWLWLMDDDGIPDDTCLAKLLNQSTGYDVLGSAVINPDDPEKLSLKLRIIDAQGYFVKRQYIQTHSELRNQASQGIYPGTANFFNGILISRRVPEKIGYVKKELFIWGDEYEYFLRIKQAGFSVGTVADAIYWHPASIFKFTRIKYYYYFRNLIYIHRNYSSVMYRPNLRWLFPIYTIVNCLRMTPSFSPKYMSKVFWAVFRAWQGQLIPYSSI
ncbi:MAG: glycosyltransferase [Leptolyngbya sp. RL_3_1]|nr:glycosyltransferase [Leptolyngbya sp. RL_3_1]